MASRVPEDARQLIETIARTSPEWQPWLRLQEEALRAIEDPAWDEAVPEAPEPRSEGMPQLAGLILPVDRGRADNWLRRLLEVVGGDDGVGAGALALATLPRADRLDALALLEAAICQDTDRLETLAGAVGVEVSALGTVAQLAVMPLLQASRRRLGGQGPASWPHGYCPVCGAWPALAEVRGPERARRLRCARCGADWAFDPLRCPYCGTTDDQRLGTRVPEEGDEAKRVDTCQNCQGYLKAIATLQAWPPYRIALEDLATVELDIAALERGFTRPERLGYPLGARVIERTGA